MSITKLHLKKGDKVLVLSGKDKGKTGMIERVSVKTASVLVEGVNIAKKHVKVSKKFPTGGVAEVVKPLPAGKVQLICPSCNKATRVGISVSGKEKSRVCKKCGKTITKAAAETKVDTKKEDKKKKAK